MTTKEKIDINEIKLLQGSKLIPYIKLEDKLTCTDNKLSIVVTELEINSISEICNLFDAICIPYTTLEANNDLNQIEFPSGIINLNITVDLFLKSLKLFYLLNTANEGDHITLLCNFVIRIMFSQIKVVSQSLNDPLSQIIEQFLEDPDFDHLLSHFEDLLQFESWNKLLKEDDNQFNSVTIKLETWLHLIRHPSKNLENFSIFLKKISPKKNPKDFLLTYMPLITEKGEWNNNKDLIEHNITNDIAIKLSIITILNGSQEDFNPIEIPPENRLSAVDQSRIVQYWFSISSLILRNINYSLSKFNNLALDKLDSNKIRFYEYFKSKMISFSESCYNPALIEAFKAIETNKILKGNVVNGIEFYLYNKGSFLERKHKEAEKEYIKNSENKIIRKRFNRRKNRLYGYFNSMITVYEPFLTEISELKLVHGKYASVAKIIKLDDKLEKEIENNLIINN